MVTRKVNWLLYGVVFQLLCFNFSLAIPTTVEEEHVVPTSGFPIFLRSRFNPRMQQTNESLISISNDEEEALSTHENQTAASDISWNYNQAKAQLTNKYLETNTSASTEHQSENVDQQQTGTELLSTECGIINPDQEHFPWIAILEHSGSHLNAGRKRTLSKGVLIDQLHVLTTVSSVHNSHPSWVVTGVRLGDTPTRRYSNYSRATVAGRRDNSTLRFPIETVFLHESKDIALIRLGNGGLRHATESIRPICMPREDYRLENFQLTSHVCQRQQATDSTRQAFRISRSKLQLLNLTSVDDCNGLLRPYGARLPVKSFCAQAGASDNCTGSIGGPAIASIRGKYYVLGLHSYIHTEVHFQTTLIYPQDEDLIDNAEIQLHVAETGNANLSTPNRRNRKRKNAKNDVDTSLVRRNK